MDELSDTDMNEGSTLHFDNLLPLQSNVDQRFSMGVNGKLGDKLGASWGKIQSTGLASKN